MNILTVNLLLSTFVFWIAARLYLLPRLHACEPRDVLLPILLLHALRHLGLMFLAPGAVYPGIPAQFAVPAAFGDLLAAVLAVIAIPGGRDARAQRQDAGLAVQPRGLARSRRRDRARHPVRRGAVHGTRYWIPAFWVPALLVTHYITFLVLLAPWPEATKAR